MSSTSHFTMDAHGSIREFTDKEGTLQRYRYTAYGKTELEKSDANPDNGDTDVIENPYTYTSRELDWETGLMFYRARFYSPEQGRFFTEDRIGLAGGLNRYVYVKGNPIINTDSSGQIVDDRIGLKNMSDFQTDAGLIGWYQNLQKMPQLIVIDRSYFGENINQWGQTYTADAGKTITVSIKENISNYNTVQALRHELIHVDQLLIDPNRPNSMSDENPAYETSFDHPLNRGNTCP